MTTEAASSPRDLPRARYEVSVRGYGLLRAPYPMGFYTKWLDGRIDHSGAGWKRRGL